MDKYNGFILPPTLLQVWTILSYLILGNFIDWEKIFSRVLYFEKAHQKSKWRPTGSDAAMTPLDRFLGETTPNTPTILNRPLPLLPDSPLKKHFVCETSGQILRVILCSLFVFAFFFQSFLERGFNLNILIKFLVFFFLFIKFFFIHTYIF